MSAEVTKKPSVESGVTPESAAPKGGAENTPVKTTTDSKGTTASSPAPTSASPAPKKESSSPGGKGETAPPPSPSPASAQKKDSPTKGKPVTSASPTPKKDSLTKAEATTTTTGKKDSKGNEGDNKAGPASTTKKNSIDKGNNGDVKKNSNSGQRKSSTGATKKTAAPGSATKKSKEVSSPTPSSPAPESSFPEVDKKELKEQFEAFAKFGDKTADGKTIKLSQSDKWFKQAKVFEGRKISTVDTGIAFRKISKNAPKLSFVDWNKYLDEISKNKKVDGNELRGKLVACGKPAITGTTSVAKSSALDRLTDSSRYGGTHKQRFDTSGKGKGKEGRVDPKSDGYVAGYKQKGNYDKKDTKKEEEKKKAK